MISGQLARSSPSRDAIDLNKVRGMRIMQFSDSAFWAISRAPLGLLKGKTMESRTSPRHVKEKKHGPMEEFLGSPILILVYTALLLGLEKIT